MRDQSRWENTSESLDLENLVPFASLLSCSTGEVEPNATITMTYSDVYGNNEDWLPFSPSNSVKENKDLQRIRDLHHRQKEIIKFLRQKLKIKELEAGKYEVSCYNYNDKWVKFNNRNCIIIENCHVKIQEKRQSSFYW